MFALRHSDVLHTHNASKPQEEKNALTSGVASQAFRFNEEKSLPEWFMAELSNLKMRRAGTKRLAQSKRVTE